MIHFVSEGELRAICREPVNHTWRNAAARSSNSQLQNIVNQFEEAIGIGNVITPCTRPMPIKFFCLFLGQTTFVKIHLDTGLPQSRRCVKEAPKVSLANLMRLISIDSKSTGPTWWLLNTTPIDSPCQWLHERCTQRRLLRLRTEECKTQQYTSSVLANLNTSLTETPRSIVWTISVHQDSWQRS